MDNDMTSMTTAGQAGALRRLLTSGGLRAVYQPVIDLDTYAPVAYEALVRGPQGSPLESPAALFGQAAAAGFSPSSTAPPAPPPSRARWPRPAPAAHAVPQRRAVDARRRGAAVG